MSRSTVLEQEFGQFDDDSLRIVAEAQLRNYGNFMEEYASQLREIEDALDDRVGETWDFTLDPISLQCIPYEQTSLLELIRTDNKLFNKVITVLSALCCEIDTLRHEAETKFYPALLFYGEGVKTSGDSDGDAQLLMGRMISTLQDLFCFVSRCYDVARNTVQQMSALHCGAKNTAAILDVTHVHFMPMFEHLSELLKILITLDEVIGGHTVLKEHWTLYKRMLQSVHHNPTKFGFTEQTLRPFEKLVMKLEMALFDGNIFANCVDGQFDDIRNGSHVTKNSALAEEMAHVIKTLFGFIEPMIGEATENDQRFKFIGLCGLYVLYVKLYQTTDKKLFKQFWDSYRRIPGIQLTGNVMWFPNHFLSKMLPNMVNTLDRKARVIVSSAKTQWLNTKTVNLVRDAQQMKARANVWMIQMESHFHSSGTVLENLDKRCLLFRQGLFIARAISHSVTSIMNMHVYESRAMSKSLVIQLCGLVELLKAVQMTFHRRSMLVSQSVNHIAQRLSFLALTSLAAAKKRIVSDKRYSDRRLDVLSAIVLAETALNGPNTKERKLLVDMALCMATRMRSFKDDELAQLSGILKRLSDISCLQEILRNACDASFLYWHRVIFPTYIANLYENSVDVYKIKYMFSAFQDCFIPLMSTKHVDDPSQLLDQFNEEICADFRQNLVEPLCRAIETELRLDIHHHEYQLDSRNPFSVGLKDLTVFLKIKPIKFYSRFLDIKAAVERYLDTTFYNLTTVALHDWKKYSEMRHVATQKYGLQLTESHLPSQTLEQGLDVLEIMRNIQVFVSKYSYNLNNQIFVERTSNNKHLNTINIRHVANSIRTHGTGIMNTTVNFTFQFLKQKFFIFSQFLFDEHIKSKLIKDWRFFRENHSETDQKYPYDRADKFNKGIRKLGVGADGQSYLDRFRLLITEIGNAMGYIRMIRSGGLHCCSSAIRFIPDLDDIISFEDCCRDEGLATETEAAAQTLDRVVESMVKNFSEGTEYFKMLVNVFAPEFRDQKHIHLKNFFMIIPPLTVNFVEHSISCKEKMTKKNKQDALFTDDGFAMGVAYILKLLDQYNQFDSLHWFTSVLNRYKGDRETARKQAVKGSSDEKLTQTMSLTTKRLDTYQQEFNLLYYSLRSARIFFRADQTAEEEKEKEESKTKSDEQSEGNSQSTGEGTTAAAGQI